jgi:hypothetical protein
MGATMRYAAVVAFLLTVWPSSAAAQSSGLPHNIPDFCATSQEGVPAGQTETWTGIRTMDCVAVRGHLVLRGLLRANMILIYTGGFLDVACGAEIVIRDTPLNLTFDPEQYGQGIIAVGGRVLMNCDTGRVPFLRTAAEPVAGSNTITVASATSHWLSGDRVFVPDSRQLPESLWFASNLVYQHETRILTAVNGAFLGLDVPLTYTHRGARDANGTPTVLADGTRLLPHVANLTRGIIVRSENPTGVRGHVLATARADVDIRGVHFKDLGRTRASVALNNTTFTNGVVTRIGTNQIGRYPVHIHHLMGPLNPSNTGYQFTLIGNVIENSEKWPMAIHNSHFGLIEDNVIVGGPRLTGAGLAFEDGPETENLVRRNFIADIRGGHNPRSSQPFSGLPGAAGECLWAAGFNNRFIDNVMAGCRNSVQQVASGVGAKFVTLPHAYTVFQPRWRGADTTIASERIAVDPKYQPILQFDGNEIYGLASAGLTTWQLGTTGYTWNTAQAETLVRDLKVWNVYSAALWFYPTNRMTVERLAHRIDPAITNGPLPFAAVGGDYRVVNLTVRDSSIHASGLLSSYLTDPLGTWRLERNQIAARATAFLFATPNTGGTGANRSGTGGVTMQLTDNVITPWPNRSVVSLNMLHSSGGLTADPYRVFVTNHQGVSGVDFQACRAVQATQALYGGTCPGATTRPDVIGIVIGSVATPPPAEICGDGIDNDDKFTKGAHPHPHPHHRRKSAATTSTTTATARSMRAARWRACFRPRR